MRCLVRECSSIFKYRIILSHFRDSPPLICQLVRSFINDAGEKRAIVPRRALLYVPGDNERMVQKARGLKADCICLDMEDGVSANSKGKARQNIVSVLEAGSSFGSSEVAVRINSISSGLAEEDINAVFSSQFAPSTLVVPKVDKVDHVKWLVDRLARFPSALGVQVISQVESAEALLNLNEICKTLEDDLSRICGELAALIFGSDDFCASIGAKRSAAGTELMYARQKIVAVAKAYKAQAIDMVHIDYKDLDGLRKYSLEGASMGFTGKQVIHPSQVPVVQECFRPSDELVKWANELIEAFNLHGQHGKGAFVFRDQMIDKPSLLQAQNIKDMAETIWHRDNSS